MKSALDSNVVFKLDGFYHHILKVNFLIRKNQIGWTSEDKEQTMSADVLWYKSKGQKEDQTRFSYSKCIENIKIFSVECIGIDKNIYLFACIFWNLCYLPPSAKYQIILAIYKWQSCLGPNQGWELLGESIHRNLITQFLWI